MEPPHAHVRVLPSNPQGRFARISLRTGRTRVPTGHSQVIPGNHRLILGCLQDITGSTSGLGISVQKGAQAAVDEINENGGIDGKDVVLKRMIQKGMLRRL